jgi:hypothetical protein
VPLGKRLSFCLVLGEWRIDDGRSEKLPNLADNPFSIGSLEVSRKDAKIAKKK